MIEETFQVLLEDRLEISGLNENLSFAEFIKYDSLKFLFHLVDRSNRRRA
jgi:hypothetical protein